MLLAAARSTAPGCLAAAVASAAALSLQSPFLGEESERSLPADMSEEGAEEKAKTGAQVSPSQLRRPVRREGARGVR